VPRITIVQTNFTAGELSPRLLGRVDIARYSNGAKRIENATPLVHGGVARRPGLRFVARAKHADKNARLIPYVFNRDQAYVVEFGDRCLRFYANGAQILGADGAPCEIATPYSEDMLFGLDYVQGADTMFVAHPEVPIHRLRRFDHDNWSFAPAPFTVTPFDEIGLRPDTALTLSGSGVGETVDLQVSSDVFIASDVGREIAAGAGVATIVSVAGTRLASAKIVIAFEKQSYEAQTWNIAGSPQATLEVSAKDPIGAAITLSSSTPVWRPDDVGKFVEINRGLVELSAYASAVSATGIVRKALDSSVASPPGAWSLESSVWNEIDGYPRSVTLSEQRLVAAGSPGYPQTVWMSRVGEYLNFEIGVADDDAIAFTISSDQINPIAHLAQARSLIALTYGGEFTLSGGDKAITPTNIQVKNQTVYGCGAVRPVRVGNEVFFVQRANRKLRAMSYKFDLDAFGAPDLSVLAEHITAPGIRDMAYQQENESLVWLVRADGVAATLTIDRDQDVIGWARQETDGRFESVAAIPTANGEEVWALVCRSVGGQKVRNVERFDATVRTDSATTGSHPDGSAVWENLGHLEGKEVDVLADGVVMRRRRVENARITLERTAKTIEVGLPYTTTIETLTPEVQGPTGSAQGNSVRVSEATLKFFETIGCEIDGQEIPFRDFGRDALDRPIAPWTGDTRVEKLGWARGEATLCIRQKKPLPFHLLSVVKKFQFND
jgi:hypothetical protein